MPHQLHGDGACDWGASQLPPLQGTTNQSRITASPRGGCGFVTMGTGMDHTHRLESMTC